MAIRCYGCPADEQEPRYVFDREEIARSVSSGNFSKVNVNGRTYYIADFGMWEQERVAIEIMYYMIEGSNSTSRGITIDSHGRFCTRLKSGPREQSKTASLSIPSVDSMFSSLRDGLGYFRNNGKKAVCQSELIKILRGALPS